MKIVDLLEELQKHGEEEIKFYLFNDDLCDAGQKLEIAIIDGRFLFKVMGSDGNWENAVSMSLVRAKKGPIV